MAKSLEDLSKDGRMELALALFLWKEFKAEGKLDPEIYLQAFELAKMLGVNGEFDQLNAKMPALKIQRRYE